MTTTRKITGGLLIALVLGLVFWRLGIEPAEKQVSPEGRGWQTGTAADTELAPTSSGAGDELGGAIRSLVLTSPSAPLPETPGLQTKRIKVVHAKTGVALPQATVLHCASGFDWQQLDAKAKEEYSLSTERFLSRFGETLQADVHGVVHIPIEAAYQAVVGRKGDLYGAGVEREGEVWKLALLPHYAVTVEVVDSLDLPVAGVRVLSRDKSIFNPFQLQSQLGTTDEHGLVTHLFKARDPPGMPQMLSVFASLPSGNYGAFDVDPEDPPRQPVRITLPPTGIVRILILDPSGNHLDPSTLGDPNVQISVIDPAAPASSGAKAIYSKTRQFTRIEVDGYARFSNVILGKTMVIKAPTLLGSPIEFRGPRDGKVDVLVEHRMHRDHPALVGRLLDVDHRPMPNTQFSIMCRSDNELLSMVGGKTDDQGWFSAYLSEKALGERPEQITFGMEWNGLAPSRAVQVPVRVQLTGRIQVGDVVLPEAE